MQGDDPEGRPTGHAALALGRLEHTTGFLVRRLHNALVASWAEESAGREVRVTPVQAGLMILIRENPGVTQADLLRTLDVESATLVRAVAKLVERGLVAKARSRRDRRAFYLSVTEAGRAALPQVEAMMAAREARLAEALGHDDLAAFHAVLHRLIADLSPAPRTRRDAAGGGVSRGGGRP